MIGIIKTQITNKSAKTFIYRLSFGTYTLVPGASIVLDGDLFTKETRQEGVTESILVSAYNGELDITISIDDKFVANVIREEVTKLPARSQMRLIDKKEVKHTPVKVQVTETAKPVVKEEPKVEAKPVVKEEPKVEAKPVVKAETKQEKKEEASLEQTELAEPKKPKKAAKL